MSVRLEPITATDMLPAPTRLAASNATVLLGGLAMALNARVRPLMWSQNTLSSSSSQSLAKVGLLAIG